MNTVEESRLDPAALTAPDREFLDRFSDMSHDSERPRLCGREGVEIPLPDVIFHHLVRVVRNMREGKAVILLPDCETFTTQAAADFLGASRPYVVGLLDSGRIPSHLVGTHRRVYFKDLLDYRSARDKERRHAMDALNAEIEAAGVYDT